MTNLHMYMYLFLYFVFVFVELIVMHGTRGRAGEKGGGDDKFANLGVMGFQPPSCFTGVENCRMEGLGKFANPEVHFMQNINYHWNT